MTRGQDVWVVDVSRIGRGESLTCNAPGPGCVSIATGDHVVHAGFVADTLLVDDVPAGGGVRMPTAVLAWRADWTGPVAVTKRPAAGCWTDSPSEAVACLELSAAAAASSSDGGTSDVDAGASAPGDFRAGRLSQARRDLVQIPQGREMMQALPASDRLLVLLSPGIAAVHLASGEVEVLQTQMNGAFAVTPDEKWLLSLVSQRTDASGTRSLVATPFPASSPRHVLLENVSRHDFVEGPRRTGADILAIATGADGADHLVLAGPDASGAAATTDLGAWSGTTAAKLDATSGGGYAVVAGTQGAVVVPLLASGTSCSLGDKTVSTSQVLTDPTADSIVWVAAAAGAAGAGYRSSLSACAKAETFAASAMSLQIEADRQLLYLDSAKHLLRLALDTPAAVPLSMRDPDEVVYRWAYSGPDDLLILEMTSAFDTETRLYALRHPFPSP